MHGRIGYTAQDHGRGAGAGQLEVARNQDGVDQHHRRQNGTDHEYAKRQRRCDQKLASIELKNSGKCTELNQALDHRHYYDHQAIVGPVGGAQVQLPRRIAPAKPKIGHDCEHHKIIDCPGPKLSDVGRNAATDEGAGDVEAEGPITEHRTDQPTAKLAEARMAEQEKTSGQQDHSHVGDDPKDGRNLNG